MRLEIKESGPLKIAQFDCHDFEGPCTLENPKCRAEVIKQLRTEGAIDRVALSGPLSRVYCSSDISALTRTIATSQQLALDRSMYGGDESKKCEKCIDERISAVTKALDQISENPHDFEILDSLAEKTMKEEKGDCKMCARVHFEKLVDSIENILRGLPFIKKLKPEKYDEVFVMRQKPFFVEGVWNPPPAGSKLIETYKLSENRGTVRIYERPDNPVLFYDLDLPEFKLPQEQLDLLDSAFRVRLEGAPGHARFAYSGRMLSFAQEWYNVLLHMLKDEKQKLPTTELQKLSNFMAEWLTSRVLEPIGHDDHITDVYISAPPELQPLIVEHERWGKMETGIYWDTPSLLGLGETLASRLGTSFDEVRPQLDAEIPELGMRLFLSRYPAIWARSVEIAVRKRRSKPWTQPLFLERGTMSPLASALLGNVLRLGSSAFVIGEMGTAKTSQVETYIPEIGPQNRIVTFQDTEELHIEDFIQKGYKLVNVRVSDPGHLDKQVNAFLRGGASYWLITEVRAAEAVRAALGAAARQGSQPVVASFHARSKREMFDLVVHIMGLHEAAFKYVDFIISTARFTTKAGTIRRIVEIAEVRKDWKEIPEYVDMFVDDRKSDTLAPKNFLSGNKALINRLNGKDLSKVEPLQAAKKVDFLPPNKGGSHLIPQMCKRMGMDEEDFLKGILVEARMKSDILALARKSGDQKYLELPFISSGYNAYFNFVKRNATDFKRVLGDWRAWLKKI